MDQSTTYYIFSPQGVHLTVVLVCPKLIALYETYELGPYTLEAIAAQHHHPVQNTPQVQWQVVVSEFSFELFLLREDP
jgi:hypothetical protein